MASEIKVDADKPGPPLVITLTNDFSDGITGIVDGINAQIAIQNAAITAQNIVEAAKQPPGPVTPQLPLQTRNGYIMSLITPNVDSTARSIRETSIKDDIAIVLGGTKAERAAFRTWRAANIQPH